MMDTPQSNQNTPFKRNKRWRRFRGKKHRPQAGSVSQHTPSHPSQGQQRASQPQAQSQRSQPQPQKIPTAPGGGSPSLEYAKRSQAREILPPDYKLPEDLDVPTYVFGQGELSENEEETTTEGEVSTNQPLCPLCNYPIKKFYTTVRHPAHDTLVHFDCALREIFQQYKSRLARDQRIYYIGAGRFAIVKEIRDKRGNLKNYQIVEKIEYEKHE
ncbi:MAG: hypothetical protein N2314_04175 [Brevinematales bacterium]|nr:hypothetical protein [Brevinematales bacterium]